MATRFYFSATDPAAVDPPISATDWQHINPLRRKLNSVKGTSPITTVTYSPDAADHMVFARAHICQFVSDILEPQTIAAQQVKLQVRAREIATSDNLFVTWKIYAVSDDGQTIVGTLLPVKADATEAGQTMNNRADSATTTAFTTARSFRLVVEMGLSGTPTPAGGIDGHNGELSVGEATATDLPEDDTSTTALNPWLQFEQNLNFVQGQSVTYQFVDRCQGGGHMRFDITVNNGITRRMVFTTDEIRTALTTMTEDERTHFLAVLMRIHMADKTRAEIDAELASGPFMVTI